MIFINQEEYRGKELCKISVSLLKAGCGLRWKNRKPLTFPCPWPVLAKLCLFGVKLRSVLAVSSLFGVKLWHVLAVFSPFVTESRPVLA